MKQVVNPKDTSRAKAFELWMFITHADGDAHQDL